MKMKDSNNTSSTTTTTSTKSPKYAKYDSAERLGYLNIGILVPSKDGTSEVLASPFLGTEVKTEVHPVKSQYMTESENALWQAIVRKLEEMDEGDVIELPLTVQLVKPKAKVDTTADTNSVDAMYNIISSKS